MYSQILVLVDGSAASLRGLREAIKVAKWQGGKLRLLHIVKTPLLDRDFAAEHGREHAMASLTASGKKILNKAEGMARQEGLSAECVMFESVSGPAADVILDQAEKWPASLIVMGSHAGDGAARVGRDTAEVLAHAQVPVVLIRERSDSSEAEE